MKRFLGILLSLALVLGLMPGMSLPARAAETKALDSIVSIKDGTFNATYGCYTFDESEKADKVSTIEALVWIEGNPSWGQIQVCNGEELKLSGFNNLGKGIHKYTWGVDPFSYTENQSNKYAQILLGGGESGVNGKLIAYKIVFSDSTEETKGGDWLWPAFDIPTGLTATVGQTLTDVPLPTATNGTWTWADSTTDVGEAGIKTFNATFTPNDNTLYTVTNVAVPVTVNASAYTVTFHANGGTGTMEAQMISPMTELTANTFTRSGYLFTGWNTAADGTGTSYRDGWVFLDGDLTSDITLYAQWVMPNVKVGAVYKAGDEMVFDGESVILKADSSLYNNNGSYVVKINSIEDKKVDAAIYLKSDDGIWYGQIGINFTNAVEGANCMKITSGSGTESNPYILELAVAKVEATITKVPTAKSLTYSGQAQELVTAGTAENGTMYYALGADATTEPEADAENTPEEQKKWGISIPAGTDAGTYYVWYKVVGNEGHGDTEPACITVTIANRSVTPYIPYVPSETATPSPTPAPAGNPSSAPAAHGPVGQSGRGRLLQDLCRILRWKGFPCKDGKGQCKMQSDHQKAERKKPEHHEKYKGLCGSIPEGRSEKRYRNGGKKCAYRKDDHRPCGRKE